MTHKVIWKEGTFILPQHFQQQERFLLSEVHRQTKAIQPFSWGFSRLEIVESELAFGQISLQSCVGQFQDGTSFMAPQSNKLPSPITLEDGITNAMVYLVLPQYIVNNNELTADDDKTLSARFQSHAIELSDATSNSPDTSEVAVGDIYYRLAIETKQKPIEDGYMKLPIAKVKSVVGGKIELDDNYLPTLTNALASPPIKRFLKELIGMLNARGDSLSQRATSSGRTSGVSEYSDFLLLQLINRLEPLFQQRINLPQLHPYTLYELLVTSAGELSTFMKSNRRPAELPIYSHDDLNQCFDLVFDDIDTSFKVVLDQIATQIALSKPKNNVRAARLSHKALLENGTLIIAVAAQIPEESIRNEFPAQVKIGPGEKIYQLVQSALPGISISLLTHVPQEIPYRSGYCYFELNKNDALWQDLLASKGLAIHVGGNFPGLVLDLWAINRK